MKILFYENPKQHGNNRGESLCQSLEKVLGAETRLAKSLKEADSELESDSFDIVIIHHRRNEDIAFLKRNHPDQKYAGYSGAINSSNIPKQGSIGEEVLKDMKKYYDVFLFNLNPLYIKNVLELKGIRD
jgi:hypothetical protein